MESSSDNGVLIKSPIPQTPNLQAWIWHKRRSNTASYKPLQSLNRQQRYYLLPLPCTHLIAILSCELFGPEISSDNLQQTVTICHTLVNLKYEDDQPVVQKSSRRPMPRIWRKVIDKLQETYASDLKNLNFFAYDGEKSLFTIGALQNIKDVFIVVVEDASSTK